MAGFWKWLQLGDSVIAPTILSARLIGGLIVVVYSEDVTAQDRDNKYRWAGASSVVIDSSPNAHTDQFSSDPILPGALVTLDVDAGAFVSANDDATPNEAQHIVVDTGGENGAAESSAGLATDVSGVRASGPSSL